MSTYQRMIRCRDDTNRTVDVYDVLAAFEVVSPPVQHAIKKLLCAGKRGSKTALDDLSEAWTAIERAIEMERDKQLRSE